MSFVRLETASESRGVWISCEWLGLVPLYARAATVATASGVRVPEAEISHALGVLSRLGAETPLLSGLQRGGASRFPVNLLHETEVSELFGIFRTRNLSVGTEQLSRSCIQTQHA